MSIKRLLAHRQPFFAEEARRMDRRFKIFRQENGLRLQNGTDAISHLAFDHDRILADALRIAGSGGL